MTAPEARRERKVVSVLFADLVGFTAEAEALDPEDVEGILRPYHERLRHELERRGGTVEKFIGDAVMAVFGAPVAHEDDPERAVRAALAIRDWAREEDHVDVRIAVNTGEALVNLAARPEAGEAMVAGDVVNTAARMQAGAPTNGILVCEQTYNATRHVIEYAATKPVQAKGKAHPVSVWEAVQARSRFGVDVRQQGRAPLVGREREHTLLVETLGRVRAERSPQLVTVVGVPGIGKSRLVYELFRSIERGDQGDELIAWRQGRSLPYGEGVSFWALAEIVKAQAGILETDTSEEAAAKLGAAVAVVGDPREAAWVEAQLRPLVGLGGDDEASADRRTEAFAAWRRFLEAIAEDRPLVLVFDDLHWADDGLLDFVDYLVDWASGVPLLVVATARPELHTRRPGWSGGKSNALTISLSPLSEHETAQLVHALLERAVLPADVQSALLERAAGNPLYAEEFVRMVADRGLDVRDAAELPLPGSVQGMIAARLDAVAPEEKALLQDAAVVGKVFWLGAVAAIGEVERHALEERLHGLERKEFVARQHRSAVGDEREFAFRHGLIRDVAYTQIPRGERARKHCRAAEWLEALAPERSEDRAEMLAYHYLAALELARATGDDTSYLAGRARLALREAGERAYALNAFRAASQYYGTALELWPEDPERPLLVLRREEAEFHSGCPADVDALEGAVEALLRAGETERAAEAEMLAARSWWLRGERDVADAHADRALALVRDAPPSPAKATVLVERAQLLMVAGEPSRAIAIGREGVALAEELGLDRLTASGLISVGTARDLSGDPEGLGEVERGLEIALRVKSPHQIGRAYNNIAEAKLRHGELDEVQRLFAEMEAFVAHDVGTHAVGWFESQEGALSYVRGDWDRAERLLESFLAAVEAGSPHYLEAQARLVRARIRHARGDVEGAFADAERAVDAARRAKDPQALGPAIATLALLRVLEGRPDRAPPLVDELMTLHGAQAGWLYYAWVVDLAWLLVALGRRTELAGILRSIRERTPWYEAVAAITDGDLVGAADVLGRIGACVDEAFARLRAAEQLAAEGRRVEADAQLRPALRFYRGVGATHYVRRGEALLAASA